MPASPLDSAIYRDLFGDAELARLFTDSAEVRAMLLVEGTLAKVQGGLGLIPQTAAAFLHRASHEVQVDPAALAASTGKNAVPVPGLVAATRTALQAPEHAAWLHYGATSQDIAETGLVLRLRQALAIMESRLTATIRHLGALADAHADTPMMGRTYGQDAVPTTFGAVCAAWGAPLLRHRERLAQMRPRLLTVSLSGAAGTLSAMGHLGPQVRAGLAQALDLHDPGDSWHAQRDRTGEFAAWCGAVTASLGKMGADLILMAQSDRREVQLGASGGSSTMPQKENPVGPSVLVALARLSAALEGAIRGAGVHAEQRDGAAWMTEWLTLPQLALATGRALALAQDLTGSLTPDPQALRRPLDAPPGLWAAEALTFALSATMPRPAAEKAVKTLVAKALETGTPLAELAAQGHPGTDWHARLSPGAVLGEAPAIARRFAAAAQKA